MRKMKRARKRERESCMHADLSLSLSPMIACPHSKRSSFIQSVSMRDYYFKKSGNTKGRITVLLTPYLTGLELAV